MSFNITTSEKSMNFSIFSISQICFTSETELISHVASYVPLEHSLWNNEMKNFVLQKFIVSIKKAKNFREEQVLLDESWKWILTLKSSF